MSWSVTDFPYGAPAGPALPGQINFDITQSEVNPVFIQAGTEANAQQTEGREIAGFYYRVVNAHWNGTNWVCVNTANPAYGYRLNTSGAFEFIFTPATAGNITWTVTASVQTSGAMVAPTIGPAAGQQHTLPAVASDTIALLAAVQSLSNKTLVAAILSGTLTGTYTLGGTPTITAPTVTGTLAGASETLSGSLAIGTNPALSGAIRLPNNAGIFSRNFGNNADVELIFLGTDNNTYINGQLVAASGNNANDLGLSGTTWRNLFLGTSSLAGSGYTRLPNGLLLQWGSQSFVNPSAGANNTLVSFPIAFSTVYQVTASWDGNGNANIGSSLPSAGASSQGTGNFTAQLIFAAAPAAGTYFVRWFAIGLP